MRWNRLICGGLLIFGMSSGRPLCSQSSSVSPAAAGAPVVPLVSCAGDKVTVNASSSNLGSVLMGIQRCISAKIDFPAEANGKIIFDQIGPVSAEGVSGDARERKARGAYRGQGEPGPHAGGGCGEWRSRGATAG